MGQGRSNLKSKNSTGSIDSGDARSDSAANEKQFSVDEALALNKALLAAFSEDKFQVLLKRAEAAHPHRGVRGHPDAQAFMTRLQGLLIHVYCSVLPQKPWCLEPSWQGVRQMNLRMAKADEDPKVVRLKEEVNKALGLPRHAVIKPPAEEPVFTATPDGTGGVPGYTLPLHVDGDGDAAHEFWEEDLSAGGALRRLNMEGTRQKEL
mmetsp:Transcript_68898/g.165372  ORF Transcript_68898/g.165372 Transcript_68898/m.165372 type:complete len:207 (-) Transcript_68898:105-725(-)